MAITWQPVWRERSKMTAPGSPLNQGRDKLQPTPSTCNEHARVETAMQMRQNDARIPYPYAFAVPAAPSRTQPNLYTFH